MTEKQKDWDELDERQRRFRWMTQKCTDCVFRVMEICKKNPPTLVKSDSLTNVYPTVGVYDCGNFISNSACAQWQPYQQDGFC